MIDKSSIRLACYKLALENVNAYVMERPYTYRTIVSEFIRIIESGKIISSSGEKNVSKTVFDNSNLYSDIKMKEMVSVAKAICSLKVLVLKETKDVLSNISRA